MKLILYFQGNTAERKLKTQTITKTKDNRFKIETEENDDDYADYDEENMKHSERINKNLLRFT